MRQHYRQLSDDEQVLMRRVKLLGEDLYQEIDREISPGREASLAKTKVEEAVMWAVKAITG
jgi:hypothetical protein